MCDQIDWVLPPARGRLPPKDYRRCVPRRWPGPVMVGALHGFFDWRCLLCDGGLHGFRARLAGLCDACAAGLPRMIDPLCRLCGISLSSEDDTCLRCRTATEALPGIGRLRSACLYAGLGQDVMQIAKSEGGRSLARLGARLLAGGLTALWEPGMAIVPVPSRRRNRRQRGFDQVGEILLWLDLPWRAAALDCLVRADGRAQKELGRAERLSNLDGKIRLAEGAGVPLRALLLDDVCTTGATLAACAAVLRSAGCCQVDALTLFRD